MAEEVNPKDSKNKEKKISAEQATTIAAKCYQNVSKDTTSRLQVAEVEITEDQKYWKITLSIASASDPLVFFSGRLEYKIFQIDVLTGNVISMKVRKMD